MSTVHCEPDVEEGADQYSDSSGGRNAKQAIAPPERAPRHNVILWNDEHHTFDYVMKMLQEVCGQSKEAAFRLTEQVHDEGKAIVYTNHLELAELKRDQITAYGKDAAVAKCKGSMTATVESC